MVNFINRRTYIILPENDGEQQDVEVMTSASFKYEAARRAVHAIDLPGSKGDLTPAEREILFAGIVDFDETLSASPSFAMIYCCSTD